MDVRLTTLFQRVVGSTIWQVYAGSRMRDTQQGVIIVHTQDPNAPGSLAGTSSVLTYDAPRKTGPLHFDAVQGEILSFSSPDRTKGTFNLTTRVFGY